MKEVKDEKEIRSLLKSKKPVAVFYYASWCPHCRVMHEPWNELEKEKPDTQFVKMESEDIPDDLGVQGFPKFVMVKDGGVRASVDGEMSKEELKSKLFGDKSGGRRRRTRRLRRRTRKALH